MDEEQEKEFTPADLSRLRGLIRDIAYLADGDLANSGHPEAVFGPWRLMFRQMLEAAASYARAHPDAVSVEARNEVVEFIDTGWLDPDGAAVSPQPAALWQMLKDDLDAAGADTHDIDSGRGNPEAVALFADALDTAYKAGAGAPPSHGSRFTRTGK